LRIALVTVILFGLSMAASGATITGIGVEIKAGSVGGHTLSVQLLKEGPGGVPIPVGVAKSLVVPATAGNFCTGSLWRPMLGGAADLWGTTWTDTEINSDFFGVVVNSGSGGANRGVDAVRITVYTSDAGTFGPEYAGCDDRAVGSPYDGNYWNNSGNALGVEDSSCSSIGSSE
jgi:hypothetical protein